MTRINIKLIPFSFSSFACVFQTSERRISSFWWDSDRQLQRDTECVTDEKNFPSVTWYTVWFYILYVTFQATEVKNKEQKRQLMRQEWWNNKRVNKDRPIVGKNVCDVQIVRFFILLSFSLSHTRTHTHSYVPTRIDEDRPGMSTPHLICGPFIH